MFRVTPGFFFASTQMLTPTSAIMGAGLGDSVALVREWCSHSYILCLFEQMAQICYANMTKLTNHK